MVVELYPHQREAVEKLSDGKILCGGVGTGKTITSLVYFYEKVCGGTVGDLGSIKTPTDLYVITTAKKRDILDWDEDAAKLCITREPFKSVAGIKLTVDSWNNIDKYSEVKDAFFIFDEQRVVGSGSWYRSFLKIAKSNRWVLLSATPGDTWLDYIAVFVANGFVANRTEFKRNHCVYSYYGRFPKLERYLEVGKLVKWRNQLLVDMPYERHTTRHIHNVLVDYDQELFQRVVKDRWHVYENRPLRDVSELFSVMRKVVNSDASRLSQVRSLITKHPRLIVFYNFDYELEMLRTLVPEGQLASRESILEMKRRLESDELSGRKSLPPEKSSSLNLDPSQTSSGNGSRSSSSGTSQRREESSESELTDESITLPTLSSSGKMSQKVQDELRSSIRGRLQQCGTTPETRKAQDGGTTLVLDRDMTECLSDGLTSKSQQTNSKLSLGSNSNLGSEIGLNTSVTEENVSFLGDETDRSGFQVAEWNGHKHEPIPKTDRWIYLVQYRAGAEGWNCIETDAMVFYSWTYSYKDFHQAHGRIDRLNTPFLALHYYNLVSKAPIDRMIGKALKEKRNFNESGYAKKF